MKRSNVLIKAICAAILVAASLAYANVRVEFPAQFPGPPRTALLNEGSSPTPTIGQPCPLYANPDAFP
jgi:hypothetical protein